MKIQLSDHFTFRRLLRFTLPSIAMMIFSSVYIIIDGFFVSNYVGATAFAAVNLIMPVLMILSSMGFMIGTGGSALVSMTGKAILRSCLNGSSELMTYIAASVVDMLYNMQLLKYIGEPGVAAYGVIMYYFTVAAGLFMGYSLGAAPVISYNYGSENTAELKGLFKKSLILTGIFSVIVTIASELGSGFISSIFVGYDAELMNLTVNAFRIYSVAFLFMGFNMFASSFFTALNNGPVSALISFARTLVFEVLSILILPGFLGVDGIWGSVIVAEAAALVLSIICLIIFRKKYKY